MAWTTGTYAGEYAFGPDGVLKTGLFELFRAVNERQAAIAITKTQWYKASGTQAADIALSDLTGFLIQSSNYKTNLTRLYAAIRTMDDFFCVSDTSRTRYSTASLETAIGASLSPAITDQLIMDASLLQVAQDALDLLTIIFMQDTISQTGSAGFNHFSGSYRSGISQFPSPPGTEFNSAQDAWDDRSSYSSATNSTGWSADIHRYTDGFHGDEYDAREILGGQDSQIDFTSRGFSLAVGSTWYRILTDNEWTNDIDYTFAGVSETSPGSAATDQWFQGDDVLLDSVNTFDLSVDAPISPGVAGLTAGDSRQSTITLSQCEVIFSIASELTDQA